jgi:hypothetical protein
MLEAANLLQVGQRVWTVGGYPDHGPAGGMKVDIQGDQGGTVVANEASGILGSFSGDADLFVVKWDNGQTSKHYAQELFCIGPFQALNDFEKALGGARDSMVECGPLGGFRRFSTTIMAGNEPQSFVFTAKWIWDEHVEPTLRRLKKTVRDTRIPSAREKRVQKKSRESLRTKADFFKFVLSHKPNSEKVTCWLYANLRKDMLEYHRYVERVDRESQDSPLKLSRRGESQLKTIRRDCPELME